MDAVLFEITRRVKPGAQVIFEPGIPLFYFLSDTRPALGKAYIKHLTSKKRMELYQPCLRNNRPELVVLSFINATSENWPLQSPDDRADEGGIEVCNEIKKEIIIPSGFTCLWKNKVFEIYGKP